MATTRTRITAEEYFRISENDPQRTELVEGEIVLNHPRLWHSREQFVLAHALVDWERQEPGRPMAVGPTEVRLTDYDVYGPDAVVVEHSPELTDRETLARPPLIAVEIRSPSTWRYDVGRKKAVYEERGVPELWLVDGIAEAVLVFRRSSTAAPTFDFALELERTETLESPLLPGFSLPLAELFERR